VFVVSNVHFDQAEIVQLDHWDNGPLELVFLDNVLDRRNGFHEIIDRIAQWNRRYRGGHFRGADILEWVEEMVPALRHGSNPNLFLVPRINGYTELHAMLASVVPEEILRKYGIKKMRADFWLLPGLGRKDAEAASAYASAASQAFEEYIWTKLVRGHRQRYEFYDSRSSLRLLAGDSPFWMNRLYRLAVERSEGFQETSDHGEKWQSIEELTCKLREIIPRDQWSNFVVRRPLMGGDLWDVNDAEDCESVVEEMLGGSGSLGSLHGVLEVLHGCPTHEDFSDKYSWIKEDFERSFYRKRAKVKVTLLETIDDLPAWSADEPAGYDNILFRDLLSFFDRRDQHIVIAVRQGKTVGEIASELGHKGHAAVSRRLTEIKAKVRRLPEGGR
jgi:hypothetical protein